MSTSSAWFEYSGRETELIRAKKMLLSYTRIRGYSSSCTSSLEVDILIKESLHGL